VHLKPSSTLQSAEQPSPSVVLPSSQSSPRTMPSPQAEVQALVPSQAGSLRQSDEQPSKGMALPSSHASAPSTLPSPQVVGVQVLGLPVHLNPISTLQPSEQPSPLSTRPSSHCSGKTASPSPQRATGRHGWPGSTQEKPVSTHRQLFAQPSPETLLPSSQASSLVSSPLPHVGIGS